MQDDCRTKVWLKSRYLLLAIYKITEMFPGNDSSKLKSQIRKSCIAIPANISRGFSGYKTKDLRHFVGISLNSTSELENQLQYAHDRHFLDNSEYKKLTKETDDIKDMLTAILSTGNA